MSFFSWCQIVRFIMLVPNCPGAKLSGAKLSVFIMLVPNCPGAKLSGAKLSWCQIVRVPNCPFLLSWCQIVCFIILVSNCPVPNCPTIVQTTWKQKKVTAFSFTKLPFLPHMNLTLSILVLINSPRRIVFWEEKCPTHTHRCLALRRRWRQKLKSRV